MNKYNQIMEKICVTPEMLSRLQAAARKQSAKSRKMRWRKPVGALAACLVLIIGGTTLMNSNMVFPGKKIYHSRRKFPWAGCKIILRSSSLQKAFLSRCPSLRTCRMGTPLKVRQTSLAWLWWSIPMGQRRSNTAWAWVRMPWLETTILMRNTGLLQTAQFCTAVRIVDIPLPNGRTPHTVIALFLIYRLQKICGQILSRVLSLWIFEYSRVYYIPNHDTLLLSFIRR